MPSFPAWHSSTTKGQCEASAVCGSLTRRPKVLFAVSWPRQLGEQMELQLCILKVSRA